jgi:hypothetical protein
VLLVVVLIGGLGLAALLGLASRDVHAPLGTELMCEDVGFRVLEMTAAERVGAAGSERSARGVYRIVRLEVSNHSHEGGYDLSWHHALLMDASCGVHPFDQEGTQALRDAEGALVPAHIAQGERCVTPLVYDVPVAAGDLTLRIAWETAALLNLVDLVMHGDRRLLLGAPR